MMLGGHAESWTEAQQTLPEHPSRHAAERPYRGGAAQQLPLIVSHWLALHVYTPAQAAWGAEWQD